MNGLRAAAEQARLSEEVARDPRSLAFFPLAESYAASGRTEAALRLCLRGLEHHPEHVGAHVLLGRLYHEQGDALKAFDEWDIALRLDPEHATARRHIGLLAAEQRNWDVAVRHLEQALRHAPGDPELQAALDLARRRGVADAPTAAPASPPQASPAEALERELVGSIGERGILGVVLLDGQGRVLAGEMRTDAADRAADLAAALRGASDEAARALSHLGLGTWRTILLETPEATVHVAPVDEALLAVAAARTTPTGWVVRQAKRLHDVAVRWLQTEGLV